MEGVNIHTSFSKPEKIIEQIVLSKGMAVADFGTGHGYFVPYLSRAVGSEGKVFALDIQKSALESVQSLAKMHNLQNVKTVWANIEEVGGSKINNQLLDFVLLKNVLFQSQKKVEILKEAYRTLKSGGQLLLIDWRPDSVREIGPQEGWLIEPDEAKSLVEAAGFSFRKDIIVDKYHFGMLFKKNG